MYIFKNALKCIGRSKGRNVLIGIIALVIAVSACLGLSIRQAAQSAQEDALAGMNVTATISYDRSGAMNDMMSGGFPGGSFDKNQFVDMMGSGTSLTLEQYQTYAGADSVKEFYYTLTAYFNGSENLSPVSDEVEEEEGTSEDTSEDSSEDSDSSPYPDMGGMMGGFMGGMMGGFGSSGEFTLIGYSSDTSMTDFINGISAMADGEMFEQGTAEYTCIVSQELATYNTLSVGDVITLANVNAEEEVYELTVVGIYTSSANNNNAMSSFFGASQDPANRILMSAAALQAILDASAEVSTTVTDDYGRTGETKTEGTLEATYVFTDVDAFHAFEEEVRELGLDESYTVSSSDLTSYERSLTPLTTLSTMAGWFLVVILAIGGVILVVLNIFNVRERKYEIGVLTAMGMKKWKVAAQFVCEILIVTMVAVVLGAGVGAVCSVPVTNALLESQAESQSSQQEQIDNSFGRPSDMGNMMGGMMGGMPGGSMPGGSMPDFGNFEGFDNEFMNEMVGGAANYVTEVDSAMNLTVVLQMIGIGLLLTLFASGVSVLFVMRYDPLKILSNRD